MNQRVSVSKMAWLALGAGLALAGVVFCFPQMARAAVAAHLAFIVLAVSFTTDIQAKDSRPPLSPGSDAYEKLDLVGEGGMGVVYRARQRRLGRIVALKEVKAMQLNKVELARFRREVRVLSGLSNPHTINVFDAGVDQKRSPFYIMELLDGLDLRKLVEKEGPLVPERVVHILRQASLSLNEAHKKGIVHRDLKPANLMVCRYGGEFDFVKVLDFGLAKSVVASSPHYENITREGELPGTPAFLAPETITRGESVDARSDLYSLAAVAYYLLTARYLFQEESPLLMARAQLNDLPPPVSSRCPYEVPPQLDKLIHDCLEKDPAQRPENTEAFLTHIEELSVQFPWTRRQAALAWRDVPSVAGPAILPPPLPSERSIS